MFENQVQRKHIYVRSGYVQGDTHNETPIWHLEVGKTCTEVAQKSFCTGDITPAEEQRCNTQPA